MKLTSNIEIFNITASPHPIPSDAMSATLNLSAMVQHVDPHELSIIYPYLANSTLSRKVEHHAGRICAEIANSIFNSNYRTTTDASVKRGIFGEPIWPSGIVGSITHTQDFACAVSAPASMYYGIGIDSEKYTSEISCIDIAAFCLNSNERRYFSKISLQNYKKIIIIIFCIKEAFYKAIYTHINRSIDLSEIEVKNLNLTSGDATVAFRYSFNERSINTPVKFTTDSSHAHACVALYKSDLSTFQNK